MTPRAWFEPRSWLFGAVAMIGGWTGLPARIEAREAPVVPVAQAQDGEPAPPPEPPQPPAPEPPPDAPRDEPVAGAAARGTEASPAAPAATENNANRPSPLLVDYAQYGVALAAEVELESGGLCPAEATAPCIIGPGGGPVIRGGYRPSGPWYIGGAYEFAKLDSNNLLRLGIMQQLRAEMRYYVDVGSRFTPYATWALGGMVYGNEFGVETGGAVSYVGAGVEFELTRFAVVGLNAAYEPMLFIGFEDSAGQQRPTGLAQFVHLELVIELRTELGRE